MSTIAQIVAGAIAGHAASKEAPRRYVVQGELVLDVKTGAKGRAPHSYPSAQAYARHLNDHDARVNDPKHLAFWESLAAAEIDTRVIANGSHYTIAPEDAGGARGHGGRTFRVSFFTGEQLVTSNLWCQGSIPDAMREQLPDNATLEEVRS